MDRLDLAAVTGVYEEAAHVALRSLEQAGLADFIRHASPLTTTTRRWFATTEGLRFLAPENGTGIDRLLRTHPVSAHWQRILLARLDAVAVVYRLASAVADAVGPPRFRWYRAAPLDAAMLLPDDKTVGVIRQGPAADRTSLSDRVRRLLDPGQSRPRVLLALMPDEARLRQARAAVGSPSPVRCTCPLSGPRPAFWPTTRYGMEAPLLRSCPCGTYLLTYDLAARCRGRRQLRGCPFPMTPICTGFTIMPLTTCSPSCSSPPRSGCWTAWPTGPWSPSMTCQASLVSPTPARGGWPRA